MEGFGGGVNISTLGFKKLKIENIYNKMQNKGHRLSNEILGIETPIKTVLPPLDY